MVGHSEAGLVPYSRHWLVIAFGGHGRYAHHAPQALRAAAERRRAVSPEPTAARPWIVEPAGAAARMGAPPGGGRTGPPATTEREARRRGAGGGSGALRRGRGAAPAGRAGVDPGRAAHRGATAMTRSGSARRVQRSRGWVAGRKLASGTALRPRSLRVLPKKFL
jgi:hypothetical protein